MIRFGGGGIDKKTPRLSAFHPGSGGWLAALCASRSLCAKSWFVAYSAVLPLTQAAWHLSGKEAGLIQAGFHLGYLVSLFIVGFLSDHFGAKRAYLTTGVAACFRPWTFVLFADGFWSAFWLHALTGLCQGGTYTPALALINDHVERDAARPRDGLPHRRLERGLRDRLGVAGLALQFTGWRGALASSRAAGRLMALGLYGLRGTANMIHPRPAGESLLASLPAVWRDRQGMLSIWAYTFHNWELLGLWAWMPAFLTAALSLHGMRPAGRAVSSRANLRRQHRRPHRRRHDGRPLGPHADHPAWSPSASGCPSRSAG